MRILGFRFAMCLRLLAALGLVSGASEALWLPSAHAATNIVRAGNFYFSPTNLTIPAGDVVVWTNVSLTAHDTTANGGLWASPTFSFTGTYRFTFTNAGVYPYVCALHIVAHPEQTGTVTVVASGNLSPSVALGSPSPGQSYGAPASIQLAATASDADGQVTRVEFFQGATKLGEDTTSPYQFAWNGVGAGTYTLTARATDNAGAMTVSPSVTVTVTNVPVPVTLQNARWQNGEFIFSFASQAGASYAVYRTPSFSPSGWQWVTNVTGSGSTVWVTNRSAAGAAQFFRVESR